MNQPATPVGSERLAPAELRDEILGRLQHGPSTARTIAAGLYLDGRPHLISRNLQVMRRAGQVDCRLDRLAPYRRVMIWFVPGDTRRPVPEPDTDEATPALNCLRGVTPADLAWQRYYQLPRGQRQDAPPPSSVQ